MKKLFTLILSLVYLTTSAGVTVHLHYCMDKLIGWSLNDKDSKCKNCGKEKDGKCCKHTQQFVKNTNDQKPAESFIQLVHSGDLVIPKSYINLVELYSPLREKLPTSHAPPIGNGIDILIHNCIFRI